MAKIPCLRLGNWLALDGRGASNPLLLPAHHLVTHGVIVGMTGSGKTGLLTVLVEETLRARVPVIMIDVKGDLPDLLLAFPSFDPSVYKPWVEEPKPLVDGPAILSVCTAPCVSMANL